MVLANRSSGNIAILNSQTGELLAIAFLSSTLAALRVKLIALPDVRGTILCLRGQGTITYGAIATMISSLAKRGVMTWGVALAMMC